MGLYIKIYKKSNKGMLGLEFYRFISAQKIFKYTEYQINADNVLKTAKFFSVQNKF